MEAALRVVRYIKGTPGMGLMMPAGTTNQLMAYCDSDWGACLETRRSVTGYLVKLGGVVISWKSKKQETVSRSSAEAEFRSMAACIAELTWLDVKPIVFSYNGTETGQFIAVSKNVNMRKKGGNTHHSPKPKLKLESSLK
uniref:Reverse transcriptase Ty1/copia-type domain-containing protein n=1 Tax=Solanum lycopersicum TaxID=4081 RepID=A0A3Q7GED5_SOLLC